MLAEISLYRKIDLIQIVRHRSDGRYTEAISVQQTCQSQQRTTNKNVTHFIVNAVLDCVSAKICIL